jgi:hypothetical protein
VTFYYSPLAQRIEVMHPEILAVIGPMLEDYLSARARSRAVKRVAAT